MPVHKQVPIQWGIRRAEVDEGLAPLILALWRAGIDTVNSCQENRPGVVWVEFASTFDAERFLSLVACYPIEVFAHIDHAAAASKVGLPLRPTEVLIFGNPKAGTPLMQSRQTIGLDLPLRALVWEDEAGKVWLTY